MAHALGIQSCEIWQVTTGPLSDESQPTRPIETPIICIYFVFHLSLLLFLKDHSSRQWLGSHGTTAALYAFPFVTATLGTATNGPSACVFVSVCVCVCAIISYSRRNQKHPRITEVSYLWQWKRDVPKLSFQTIQKETG